MSLPSEKTVTCPKCQNKQKTMIWDSVNINVNPEVKEKILRNDFFKFKCGKCGAETVLAYNCLYHDMTLKQMFYLMPEYKEDNADDLDTLGAEVLKHAPDYIMRVVKTPNDLIEKIKIFDAGRDDRIIEIYKIFLLIDMAQNRSDFKAKHLYFDSVRGKDVIVAFDSSGQMIPEEIKQPVYDDLMRTYGKKELIHSRHVYQLIDRTWALSLL